MGGRYQNELERLRETYRAALAVNVASPDGLAATLTKAAQWELISVGSGGSFTVAAAMAEFHEQATGMLARAMTPLELVSNSQLADDKIITLISAEGKNNDIIEALRVVFARSPRDINIVTNTPANRVTRLAQRIGTVNVHVLKVPGGRDGYLAVNSLFMTATVLARAYGVISSRFPGEFPASIDDFRIGDTDPATCLITRHKSIDKVLSRPTVVVLFDPELRSAAIDIESKLTEAGLVNVQLADLRSFAHGRHFWLSRHGKETGIIALISPHGRRIWESSQRTLPPGIPVLDLEFDDTYPLNVLAGLWCGMHLVGRAGILAQLDPGKPGVPDFGRKLYHQSIRRALSPRLPDRRDPIIDKARRLGAPLERSGLTTLSDAHRRFIEKLQQSTFDTLICDYDGTLCHLTNRHDPLDHAIATELNRLLEKGVRLAFASGRGDSLINALRAAIHPPYWSSIIAALYNGAGVQRLDEEEPTIWADSDNELTQARQVAERLIAQGVPITAISDHPGQLSLRLGAGVRPRDVWFVVCDAFARERLGGIRVVLTSHSLDVLGRNTSKTNILAALKEKFGNCDVLVMADQLAWPGNDFEFTKIAICISCDVASFDIDNGWNLAPAGKRSADAALWYLRRMATPTTGRFRLDLTKS